jgi:hypothetical protein
MFDKSLAAPRRRSANRYRSLLGCGRPLSNTIGFS